MQGYYGIMFTSVFVICVSHHFLNNDYRFNLDIKGIDFIFVGFIDV